MSRREKTEFILEQVALCIEKGDWTQAAILSRKISTKYFARKPKKTPEQIEKDRKDREEKEKKRSVDDPAPEPEDDVTDLKLRYYEQQVTISKHDDKYLEVCKHYRQVLDTEAVEENPEQLKAVRTMILRYRRYVNQAVGTEASSILYYTCATRQRAVRPAAQDQSRHSLF